MVDRCGTCQRKTRHKYLKHYREKGKLSLSKYFQEFAIGDKVNLKTDSAMDKGRFFPRFYGLTGSIAGKKGFCYLVKIMDGNKEKTLFVHPIHLTRQ